MVQRRYDVGLRHANIERDLPRSDEEAIDMSVEERKAAVVQAQPFPDAVAENEAGIEDRHLGFGPGN